MRLLCKRCTVQRSRNLHVIITLRMRPIKYIRVNASDIFLYPRGKIETIRPELNPCAVQMVSQSQFFRAFYLPCLMRLPVCQKKCAKFYLKFRTKKSPAECNRQGFFDSRYSLGVLIRSYKENYFSAKSIVLVSSLQPVSKSVLPRAFNAYILMASGVGSKYRITSKSSAYGFKSG